MNNFTIQEALDFLNNNTDDRKCPMCQHENFILIDSRFHFKLDEYRDLNGERGHSNSVIICCENCAFMSSHSLALIEEKLKSIKSDNTT